MDDELKAIQDDLDAVLERLSGYLEDEPVPAELLAALLYRYTFNRESREDYDLETAFHLNNVQANTEDRWFQAMKAKHGEHKGTILAALVSLRDQRSWKGPIRRWAIEALSDPSDRYVRRIDHYFGEYGGQDLLRHKGKGAVKPRLAEMNRALMMVFELCKSDPENNKLSRKSVHKNVYEKVARVTHLGEVDIERNWIRSQYPEFLRLHRLRVKHGTDILDEIEGRAPYFNPQ